ncbi:MAG: hypothetical protein UY77_C0008G0001 [Candidatus Uhrbacteria bacterium GW2011_GWA2_53_10]|uniref:Uncharacterized protein n=1 Tax=Candidatus Uhrbacteria bacterium GW2011_GWA2_53_10 TaxID=1618980 RepID=A0A0G2AK41_9BACT|nr:MAG: hypothetical protein UY77_C0008G0001 [Candidatus Uhrbacteria bacterium GW2011_GWA2_53_10]
MAFWSNTSIIVKVPKKYTNDQVILNEEHNLVIVRGAVESESVKFTVLDDTPGPGICGIDPSAGPEGTEVTIVGEQFVGEDIGVRFHDNKPASTVQSIGTNTVEAVVPAGAKTGPLSFERATPSPTRSNAVPFTVGNCQTTPNLCKTGELCCADGSCDSECPVARKSHYAYRFSTGAIPVAPRVLVACNAGGVASPTPWEGWSKPEKVCVNAAIGATFNIDIETSTLTENVVVKECTDKGEDPCKSLGAAMTGALSTSNKSFSWNPTSTVTSTVGTTIPSVSFKPDTTYQVTLGAKIKSKSKIVGGVETGLVSMGEDFVWRFRTAPNNTPCKIGAVIVNPDQALADEAGHKEPYKAEPMSADDRCVQIQCALSMGTIAWSTEPSDPTIAEFIGPETSDYCGERVQANKQPPENDVKIRATITSGSGQPSSPVSDTGTLTIDFTDPNVSQAWPRCNTACINTEVGATFNTVMDSTTINKTNVKLYRCVNEVCVLTNAENTEVTNLTVAYVSLTKKVLIELSGDANFARNTFYRVVLSGAIRSTIPTTGSDSPIPSARRSALRPASPAKWEQSIPLGMLTTAPLSAIPAHFIYSNFKRLEFVIVASTIRDAIFMEWINFSFEESAVEDQWASA